MKNSYFATFRPVAIVLAAVAVAAVALWYWEDVEPVKLSVSVAAIGMSKESYSEECSWYVETAPMGVRPGGEVVLVSPDGVRRVETLGRAYNMPTRLESRRCQYHVHFPEVRRTDGVYRVEVNGDTIEVRSSRLAETDWNISIECRLQPPGIREAQCRLAN